MYSDYVESMMDINTVHSSIFINLFTNEINEQYHLHHQHENTLPTEYIILISYSKFNKNTPTHEILYIYKTLRCIT